jgi:toluene monooxygenase system ferredoxin subunit
VTLVRIAELAEVEAGKLLPCRAGSTPIVLVNTGAEICAYEDRCAHLGARLSEGRLSGSTITCAAHEWSYHASTGEGINPRGVKLTRLEVKIEDGGVFVDPAELKPRRTAPPAAEASSVGPVFESGAAANAAIEAMRALGQKITVIDRGSYLRVSAPRILRLTRAAFESKMTGLVFPRDVQAIMVSFKGHITVSDDELIWTLPGHAP